MLPDFVDATEFINEKLLDKLYAAYDANTPIRRMARSRVYFEGDKLGSETHRDDAVDQRSFQHLEETCMFKKEELLTMAKTDFEERLSDFGETLANKFNDFHWGVIREAAESSGGIVNRDDFDSSVDAILHLCERIAPWPPHSPPTFYVPEAHRESFNAAQEEIAANPVLRKRMMRIASEKNEQWRANEANRKLVD